ncbi:hypothetical protein PRUPE_5G141600 [Prunus persica]|uniref:Uncharacterized protein n=1 Tax=Prunus persica TaxID=3760 RepID=A0A251P8A1_PRUPE|nr:hypothetical protein PRUPE_5G141600 [Prunus persica]
MRDAIEGMNDQNFDDRNITVNKAQSCGSGGGGNGGCNCGDLVNNLGTIARVAPRNLWKPWLLVLILLQIRSLLPPSTMMMRSMCGSHSDSMFMRYFLLPLRLYLVKL